MDIKDLKGRKILVTGGAGFIGSHLCETLLIKGAKVTVADNFCDYYDPQIKRMNIDCVKKTSQALKGEFQCLEEDLRDHKAVESIFKRGGFDTVVHLAAMAGVRASMQKPDLYYDVNINGTKNILKSAQENCVKKIVFGSSSSVYGESKDVPFKESQEKYVTMSPYASTKREGELICIEHAKKTGANTAMLRFFTVYGPRQRPDMAINKFVDLTIQRKAIPFFGDGQMKRDYTYVDDIVKGILGSISWLDSLEGQGICEAFNLAGGRMVTLSELVDCIGKSLKLEVIIERLKTPPTEMPLTFGDIEKARKNFDYYPDYSLEKGIGNFIDWYKKILKPLENGGK